MRRLALIPARGQSKGLPAKNLARIAGETLMARAVRCAQEAGIFDAIVATTDSAELAEEARKAGASVPFLRPAHLAQDDSAVIDSVRHALEMLAADDVTQFETVALLEPTSPLRTADIVRRTVKAAESPDADAALTVSPVPDRFHPYKQLSLVDGRQVANAVEAGQRVVNRQELSQTYVRNGMCYAARVCSVMTSFSMLCTRPVAIVVQGPIVNIDVAEDLALAHRLLEPSISARAET